MKRKLEKGLALPAVKSRFYCPNNFRDEELVNIAQDGKLRAYSRSGKKERTILVEFWAKTTAEEKPGISVSRRLASVGYAAICLIETTSYLLKRLQIRFGEMGQ